MIESFGTVMMLLCMLQIKHMLGDFFFQTKIMLEGRNEYVHFGRVLHAGVHSLGSLIVFVVIGAPLAFVVLLVLAEGVVHYHIDWWKGRHTDEQKLTPADAAFWRATGIDQTLHQLTYVAMIWIWYVAVAVA